MTDARVEIDIAAQGDLAGIVALQAANQMARGGMLSAALPREYIAAMMRDMPLIVARRAGHVVGFLMTSARAMHAEVPVIRAMFAAYPGSEDAYIYGPICVDRSERGRGLAARMFSKLRRLEPGREGILFIRLDNEVSLRAHRHMGMREVARFALTGVHYAVFSYMG